RAQRGEALARRRSQPRPLERTVELRLPALELSLLEVQPAAPLAERGDRLGEQPWDRADAREIDLAARASIAVRRLVERRAVAARAGEEGAELGCRHAGGSVAESGRHTLGQSRRARKR